jgi:hypothetical protein
VRSDPIPPAPEPTLRWVPNAGGMPNPGGVADPGGVANRGVVLSDSR